MMDIRNGEDLELAVALSDAAQADKFAAEMDDVLLDIADLDPEMCPPDFRYVKGNREAWVYEHGNIAELVFVRTD